jgi:hypothetical protein
VVKKIIVQKGILPREKMELLMWDLTVADEYATLKSEKDSTIKQKDERIRIYSEIFQLHQTNKKQVTESLRYYMGHPEIFKVMNDSISARAQRNRYQPVTPKDLKSN